MSEETDKNEIKNNAETELIQLKETLSICEKERAEYLDGWKRARADLANYKKEEERRFEETTVFSRELIIREIIAVLDSFDLGFTAWSEETPEKKGMFLVRLQLEDTLKKFGLERIKVKEGEKFNPAFHECLVAIEKEGESGIIIEEVEKGYVLHGKVVRPARVKVAK